MHYYFITGTSSGIGKALVEQLLLDEKITFLGFLEQIRSKMNDLRIKKVDLSNLEESKNIEFPNLKDVKKVVLINNAGTLGSIKHMGDLSSKDIITSFNVNLTSVALISNAFIKQYQNENFERIIINISSGAAHKAYDGWAPYCATKAGLNMLTEAIDTEQKFEKSPIKAFAIAPGVVDTYMQDSIRKTDEKDFSNIAKFHNLKQSGALYEAKDVANRLIAMCENTKMIDGLVSRIEL